MSFLDKFVQSVADSKFAQMLREKVGTKTSQKISDIATGTLAVLTSPIQSISNFQKAKEETKKKSVAKLLLEGAEVALATTTPFTSAGKTAVAKIVAGATKTPLRAVATTIGAGALVGSPTIREKTASFLSPVENVQRGIDIGEAVEDLPEETKGLGAGLVTLGAGLGLGAGALAVIPKVVDYFKKDDEEVINFDGGLISEPEVFSQRGETSFSSSPVTPETTNISEKPKTRRKYKRKSKSKTEGIRLSQRVNVTVNQRQHRTTKYLNKRFY